MQELIKELVAQKNTQEIDSKQILRLPQRVKVWWVAEKALDIKKKDMKDFDHIQRSKQSKTSDKQQPKELTKEHRVENC